MRLFVQSPQAHTLENWLALVIRANSTDRDQYIVPMCDGHNNARGWDLTLVDGIKLVSANKQKTCS